LVAIVVTMRGLDLFKEESLAHYLSMILSNKLRKVMEVLSTPPKPRRARRKSGENMSSRGTA